MKLIAAVTGLSLLATIPASAEILATGSRSGNYSNTVANTQTLIPINNTAQSIVFTTSAPNQIVRVTYNAECGMAAAAGSWVAVTIKVDGVELAPASNTAFAMCSAPSTSSFGWVGAVRQSTMSVPHSGQHKVQVYGWSSTAGTWWLGDSSIVVDR